MNNSLIKIVCAGGIVLFAVHEVGLHSSAVQLPSNDDAHEQPWLDERTSYVAPGDSGTGSHSSFISANIDFTKVTGKRSLRSSS